MSRTCARPFDEALISGYLDHDLPQVEAQRVRLHLEDCATCRQLYDELRTLRETALSTSFPSPPDDRWPELPASFPSRLSRSLGWFLLLGWLVVTVAVAFWRFRAYAANPFEVFLVLGLPGALLMLFVSVLLDRLRALPTDRYRGVQR